MRITRATAFAAGLLCLGLAAFAAGAAAAASADFRGQAASKTARAVADWIVASGDDQGLPFLIVDKAAARLFVFTSDGQLSGQTPVLLGLARGDDSVPGIGDRKLSSIRPEERTTPAGRFVASLGADLGPNDVVWIDYDAAVSLHRVVAGTPAERRRQRLASPSVDDKRISYGCINVPAAFYDTVVRPAFLGSAGVVYILPEVHPLAAVFPAYGAYAAALGKAP